MCFISSRSQRYQRTIQTTHLVRCYLRIVHLFYQQSWAISVPYMKFWFLKYPPPKDCSALIQYGHPEITPFLARPRLLDIPGLQPVPEFMHICLGDLITLEFYIVILLFTGLKLKAWNYEWGGNLTFQKMFSFSGASYLKFWLKSTTDDDLTPGLPPRSHRLADSMGVCVKPVSFVCNSSKS